ncbi:MAG: nitroreductase/quinone reductase family protein [Bacteroidota bacterium]
MDQEQGALPGDLESLLSHLAREEYCYLTTRGRVTGRPHEIEIWFGLQGSMLYFLSGGGESSDWVKNMHADPAVQVRIAGQTLAGRARFTMGTDEEHMARRLLASKYQNWREGRRLSEWARTALPVAVQISTG